MKGQALITLLFFTIIATTVTSAAVVMIITNSLSGAKLQQGSIAYEVAQTGVENARLRLLRNPNYQGETLPVGQGNVVITVSKSNGNYTIISKGTIGNFTRQIQVIADYTNNLFTVKSEEEIF